MPTEEGIEQLARGQKFMGLTKWYPVDNIEVKKEEGSNTTGSADLDDTFILTGIQWQIIADGNTPNAPLQDGNFRLGWSIQRTTKFYKGPDPMAFNYGSPTFGIWRPLDTPLKISQKRTLEAIITNTVERADTLIVQVVFVGVEPDVKHPELF